MSGLASRMSREAPDLDSHLLSDGDPDVTSLLQSWSRKPRENRDIALKFGVGWQQSFSQHNLTRVNLAEDKALKAWVLHDFFTFCATAGRCY
jgi:hypothetical protein